MMFLLTNVELPGDKKQSCCANQVNDCSCHGLCRSMTGAKVSWVSLLSSENKVLVWFPKVDQIFYKHFFSFFHTSVGCYEVVRM